MELAGQVAIVTGAAGNLGSASAVRVAAEGAAVVVADRPGTAVDDVVARIVAAGGSAVPCEVDVSQEEDAARMVSTAVSTFGRLDGLVNVAATVRDTDIILDEMTIERWDHIMAVNVRGPMLGCKYAIPAMLEHGEGSIINFGSTAGVRGDTSRIAYATSKAALAGFMRTIATAYGKSGIRCNNIAPHGMWAESTKGKMGADWLELVERTLLVRRLGEADDIAHMVVYLLSNKASYITGQTLYIDGGGTAHQAWVNVH